MKVMPKVAPAEKMFEHDENGCAKAKRERQHARSGEPGGVGEGAGPALSAEKDLMVERRGDEKAATQKYKSESDTLQTLTGRRNVPEEVLEDGLKQESKKRPARPISAGGIRTGPV